MMTTALPEARSSLTTQKSVGGPSKFRGVIWHKSNGKWEARIYETGKQRFLGYFTSELAAAEAYDSRAVALHGCNAKVNFPQNHKETMHKEPASKLLPRQGSGKSSSTKLGSKRKRARQGSENGSEDIPQSKFAKQSDGVPEVGQMKTSSSIASEMHSTQTMEPKSDSLLESEAIEVLATLRQASRSVEADPSSTSQDPDCVTRNDRAHSRRLTGFESPIESTCTSPAPRKLERNAVLLENAERLKRQGNSDQQWVLPESRVTKASVPQQAWALACATDNGSDSAAAEESDFTPFQKYSGTPFARQTNVIVKQTAPPVHQTSNPLPRLPSFLPASADRMATAPSFNPPGQALQRVPGGVVNPSRLPYAASLPANLQGISSHRAAGHDPAHFAMPATGASFKQWQKITPQALPQERAALQISAPGLWAVQPLPVVQKVVQTVPGETCTRRTADDNSRKENPASQMQTQTLKQNSCKLIAPLQKATGDSDRNADMNPLKAALDVMTSSHTQRASVENAVREKSRRHEISEGVSFDGKRQRWQACVKYEDSLVDLGSYVTSMEAAIAFATASQIIHNLAMGFTMVPKALTKAQPTKPPTPPSGIQTGVVANKPETSIKGSMQHKQEPNQKKPMFYCGAVPKCLLVR